MTNEKQEHNYCYVHKEGMLRLNEYKSKKTGIPYYITWLEGKPYFVQGVMRCMQEDRGCVKADGNAYVYVGLYTICSDDLIII